MKIDIALLNFFLIIGSGDVIGFNTQQKQDSAYADTLKAWNLSGKFNLNFNQISFSNWAEGGESSLTGMAHFRIKANYKKDKLSSDNELVSAYGLNWLKESGLQKTEDKWGIASSVGYYAAKNWKYSTVFEINSQFTPGYKYPDDSTLVSDFFAPARMTLSLGMEYNPWETISLFASPASGKFIFVLNDDLANEGAFGVKPAVKDTAGNIIEEGNMIKPEFGLNLIFKYNEEITENVDVDSRFKLHNNYLDDDIDNRWNFDLNWETAVNFKINSHLSSNIFLHVMYDHDTKIPIYQEVNGEEVKVKEAPRTQFKENFGIGLSLSI